MASPLDLQEQEQLDQIKDFWKRHGSLISTAVTVVLLAFAGWNGWNWWQREQAAKAGVLYDEVDRAAQARDAEKAGRVFGDLQQRYGRTVFAAQAALLAARVQADAEQTDAAVATLRWAAQEAGDPAYRSIAGLRLAGLLLDQGKHDEALAAVPSAAEGLFAALAADRRGDILQAQGKRDAAIAAFQQAHAGFVGKGDYLRIVEAKLMALGVQPAAPVATERKS